MISREMQIILAVLAGIAVSGLLVYGFYTTFERVDVEYDAGMSEEARRNPFLAAEQFLDEMGIPAESVIGRSKLYDLPSVHDAMIVNHLDTPLSRQRFDDLMVWVRNGGRLIMPAEDYAWEEDRNPEVYGDFGIRLEYLTDSEEELEAAMDSESSDSLYPMRIFCTSEAEFLPPTTLELATGEEVLISLNPCINLVDERGQATRVYGNDDRVHVIEIREGKGSLIFLSEIDLFINPSQYRWRQASIEQHDNAYFLWSLVNDRDKVWLLHNSEFPSLLGILWRTVPNLLISLALLTAVWLWFLSNRIGPIKVVDDTVRRNVKEQIQMVSLYEWRVDRAEKRLQRTRRQLLLNLGFPPTGLQDQQRVQAIANVLDVSPDKVQLALFSSVKSEKDYIQISRKLQELMRRL